MESLVSAFLSIVPAIVVLGLLIIVHEFGHFIVAKLSGIGVETFSIGFGPRIFGRKSGETEYRLSAFPLGGYVKMIGEEPGETPENPERSFSHKPVGVRMAVVAAGPISNLLLAVLIYTVIFATGVPMLLAVIGEVQEGFPASQAGLQSGDVIRTIDSHPIEGWDDLTGIIHGSAGRPLNMTVTRGGEELKFQVTPRETLVKNVFGEETPVGLIGISPAGETVTRRYNPLAALGLGVERTWNIIYLTFIGIGKIFQRVVPADTLGGPLMIVQMAGEQAKMGFMNLVFLVAFLSIMLGVFNILPIPVLDGGHLFFFLIEALRGRPLSMKKREIIQQVGLLILISIFLFATFNDVMRIFVK